LNEEIGQDTAPRDISVCVRGRYPGSQDLRTAFPWKFTVAAWHAYTCLPLRGQPRHPENLSTSLREPRDSASNRRRTTNSGLPLPGSRL